MTSDFFVTLKEIIDVCNLETVYAPDNYESIEIHNADVNRSGLALAGFLECFDNTRLQIIGMAENTYLGNLSAEQRKESFENLFKMDIPALIITRNLETDPNLIKYAEKYNTPVFKTPEATSSFMASLISFLNTSLAERITRHGVLVEVYGEGILLLGESGVGKSETAIELIKRGHRLIADDAVEIKRVSNRTLVGSSPELIRYFIELRGIGIVDVRKIFGMGAVKESERIDLVIELENWDETKQYDRLGLDDRSIEILGLKIPSIKIPVKPGRNLAVIIEVASMNARQKKLVGYNAVDEINARISENGNNELKGLSNAFNK